MSSATSTQAALRSPPGETVSPLSYSVWPLASAACWREPPLRLVLATGLVALLLSDSVRLAALAAAVMALSTWRFFVPTRYIFDAEGIHQHVLRRRRVLPWRTLRTIEPRAGGLVLYTAAPHGPLSPLASTYIPFGPEREQVLAWVERFAPLAIQRGE